MFHDIDEFLQIWQSETGHTRRIFDHLSNNSLQQAVVPGGRTLGRLANHLIETLTEIPHKLGLGIEEEQPAYTTVQELLSHFDRCNRQLLHAIRSKWTSLSLEQETMMYGEAWKNGFSLWVLLVHMIHHRAQMTVLMRQAGLVVPGIYGPAREEWAAMNLPAME